MAEQNSPHMVNDEEIQILCRAYELAGLSSEGAFIQDSYCIALNGNVEIRQSFINCWGITTPVWRVGKVKEEEPFDEILSTPSFSEAAASAVAELIRARITKKLQEFTPNLIPN